MDYREEFDLKVQEHHKNYKALRSFRAVRPGLAGYGEISEASIRQILRTYYRRKPVGVLFYFFESGKLKAWLLNEADILSYAETKITAKALVRLERLIKTGLDIQHALSDRAPRLRSIKARAEKVMDAVSVDQVNRQLSQLLFPPAISEHFSSFEHLIIIPTLNIQEIPLNILKTGKEGRLLIDQLSHNFAPSIYDLGNILLDRMNVTVDWDEEVSFAFENPLVLGNPNFYQHGKWHLPALPGSEKEVKAIAAVTGATEEKGTLLIGPKATLEEVTKKVHSADFLYFATHGIADEENPLDNGGLMLTPSPLAPDGFWSTRAIQHLDLRADLVVLSACQTGLGKEHQAGVIGLARAFQLAGIDNVIMSLWSVDDLATMEFMKIFIKELLQPSSYFPCGALRSAMLKFRDQQPAPIYWAPFAVFGISL